MTHSNDRKSQSSWELGELRLPLVSAPVFALLVHQAALTGLLFDSERTRLQVTPERVFIGFSDGHTPLTKAVVLAGERPFRVLTVSAKASWLGTQAKQLGGNPRVWQIEVSIGPRGHPPQPAASAVVEDRILVNTDIAEMPVVEIPCYLHCIKP